MLFAVLEVKRLGKVRQPQERAILDRLSVSADICWYISVIGISVKDHIGAHCNTSEDPSGSTGMIRPATKRQCLSSTLSAKLDEFIHAVSNIQLCTESCPAPDYSRRRTRGDVAEQAKLLVHVTLF